MVLINPSSQTPQVRRQEYVNAFNKSSQRGGCEYLEHPSSSRTETFASYISFELQGWQVLPVAPFQTIRSWPDTVCVGGVGINLIGNCSSIQCYQKKILNPWDLGASRLCLIDSDWNPRLGDIYSSQLNLYLIIGH